MTTRSDAVSDALQEAYWLGWEAAHARAQRFVLPLLILAWVLVTAILILVLL